MRKTISVILILSQCACSFFVPSRQTLSITSSENDAKIYVNGDYIGKGNVKTKVSRDEDVSIVAKKAGYSSYPKEIDTKISMTGMLDFVGGFFLLIPFLGLTSSGAWSLEQTNVSVVLEKK